MIVALLVILSWVTGVFALGAARYAVGREEGGYNVGAMVLLLLCMVGCYFAGAAQ